VLSPNRKRNVKRPIIYELGENLEARSVVNDLLKLASKKLCCKARGLYTRGGDQLLEENVLKYLSGSESGVEIIVTKKKGEKVPRSPSTSPSLKPTPPALRRRPSEEDHLKDALSPDFLRLMGSAVVDIISTYARNCAAFDASSLPPTVFSPRETAFTTVTRVAPQRKKWKLKGSHKFTILGYGSVQSTIHQLTFRVDCRAADSHDGDGSHGRMAIGIVDPRKFRRKTESSYGIGDCSHSWGLGCDGFFRHRGKILKLQDGQGRTPSWKSGDIVGISINPLVGKLAFFVGRKQYRVNPRSVHLPKYLCFGVTFSSCGDQFTFLDWTEQPTMQYIQPTELRL